MIEVSDREGTSLAVMTFRLRAEWVHSLKEKGSACEISEEGRNKLKIMVSACLAGENCKYNGSNNRNGVFK